MTPSDRQGIEREGRVWFRNAVAAGALAVLDGECPVANAPGMRLAWNDRLSEAIGAASPMTRLARTLLPGAVPVRLVAFNKSAQANWLVPWHQDRVIAVREKHAIEGFRNWTKKAGLWHVEPPIDILQGKIFARVHLDDTEEENGCLELALGTHAFGRVDTAEAKKRVQSATLDICRARRGDVLFAKALILHRSRPSKRPTDRRALRIDYCAGRLPDHLAWAL